MAKRSLTTTLKRAGLYDDKLIPQIRLAERLEKLIESMNEDPDAKYSDILKAESQLQSAYTALGLTYSIKPDCIPSKQEESTDVEEMLNI